MTLSVRTLGSLLMALSLWSACGSSRAHGPTRGAFNDDAYVSEATTGSAEPGYAREEADADGRAYQVSEMPAADSGGGGLLDGFFGGKADQPMAPPPPPSPPEPSPMAMKPPEKPQPAPESSSGGDPSSAPAATRLMIYTGTATVLVPSVPEAQDKLTKRVIEIGGYVESQQGDTAANTTTITFRVPVAQFFSLKAELPTYGQVLNDTVQADDVTKQVFDLELRLDTATKSRDRLADLLKQATKMEDILQIEAELRRLTDEIEAMKGQLRFLKDRVAFSTLTVSLYSNAPPPVTGPRRTYSRFNWINQVGPERVLNEF